jgi:cytoskeletal protein CcmA (bactofilin family)
MWEKRKDTRPAEPQQKPTQTPAYSPQPTQAAPPPAAAPAPPRAVTHIGRAMTIKGEIRSDEDLFLDGDVEGKLLVPGHSLTIGPNAKVKSDIKAREVTVLGTVQGNIEAEQKVAIRKDGQLVGNITTAGITIDDEAYFKGSIDIVRKEIKGKADAQKA